jgi:hypothetical protein
MKVLLFTLLLLLTVISPSFADLDINNAYWHKQKIVYTIITNIGTINIECLWDPERRSLVPGTARSLELSQEQEFTRVEIIERRALRWDFGANGPTSREMRVAADFRFDPTYYNGQALRPGSLSPGITIINPSTFNLRWLSFTTSRVTKQRNQVKDDPLEVRFVFMSVMLPETRRLDPQTEQVLRSQGIEAFLQQGPRSSSGECLPPPLQLDGGLWFHLLSNTVSEYQPGDVRCDNNQPENPNPGPNPNPNEGCHTTATRPRDPDQDDPEAQPEAKRQARFDSNKPYYTIDSSRIATGAGGAGGSNQRNNRRQNVDVNNLPSDRTSVDWVAYLYGARKENFDAPGTVRHNSSTLYNINRSLGGSTLLSAIEYFTTSTIEENTSSLKGPRPIICYEVLPNSKYIHDELRK